MTQRIERRRYGDYYGSKGVTLTANGFRFTESSYRVDERLPIHEHEQPHFCYVVGGRYEETLGRSKTVIRDSSAVLFLPAEVPHGELHHAPGRHFMIEATAERLVALECMVTQPLQLPPDEPLMFMHKAFREYASPEPDSEFVLEGLALLLFGSVQKAYQLSTSLGSHPGWLRNMRALIDREFLRPWPLDTLSYEAGIDPEHLTSQFARTFGTTPAEYLRKRRLRYACQLIQTSDMPLTEVALSAGFADQGHFSRTFRYHMGVTPLFYLRAVRGLAGRPRPLPLPLRKAKIDPWDDRKAGVGQPLSAREPDV